MQLRAFAVRPFPVIAFLGLFCFLVPGMFAAPKPSQAMPNFAVSTGFPCSTCHTIVPQLNSFGRYFQASGYTAIARPQLDKAIPIWLDESMTYDSGPAVGAGTGTARFEFGNFGVHADGYAAPDVTYHVQQWIVQAGQSGGLDTAWIAYDHVFSQYAHLFVGKYELPIPSTFTQNTDLDLPTASAGVIAEHDWGATITESNRWGTKFAYVQPGIDAEVAYALSSYDLNGINYFGEGDKTFMWKAAYVQPKSPIEVGLFGTAGSVPVSTGTNSYNSVSPYVEIDPARNGSRPGFQFYYQSQYDSNPGLSPSGKPYAALSTSGMSVEVNELLFKGNVLLSARHDFNQLGLTGGTQNGNAFNASFNMGWRWLHGYVEALTGTESELYGASGGPTWKGMIWLTLPTSNQLP